MSTKKEQFEKTVWEFYRANGRSGLPWRKTKNPYRILVSEVMLQQTQVERVLPKYKAFLNQFPALESLAEASLSEVLIQWQGLGYNRRAKMLHECAKEVVARRAGALPQTYEELCALPGIGPYTAGAILAFAFNKPVATIETNIRTVYLHHFFNDHTDVYDAEILRLIAVTLDKENPRQWYWALMDYGAFLKKEHGSINAQSKHYVKQSKFKGSDRQIRGAIVRLLSKEESSFSISQVQKELNQFEAARIDTQLKKLLKEKLIQCAKDKYQLAT